MSGFQPERSLLAMPPDLSVTFGATKVHRVVINRRKNKDLPSVQELPPVKHCLVIGAGCSMSIMADMTIDFDKYDGIIITHPMVNHYAHLLNRDNVYVMDCEYQPISGHYYDKYASDVRLICRLGKEITTEYKQITWILPVDRKYNINVVEELVPELPYSTGAMAMWFALNKMGDCKVDMIGIDNDGVVARYWIETQEVMKGHEDRITNLAIRLQEFE